MSDLLLVVPSRGRPGNIERLWHAMQNTCVLDTRLVVGLDMDDETIEAYVGPFEDMDEPAEGVRKPGFVIRNGLRQVVAWINELSMRKLDVAPYIGHIGDDNVPLTTGWDKAMVDALQQTPFAFCNDLYPREPGSLCCHVFTRSQVIRTLGYFGPPGIRHMYVDVAWMAWGVKTGITYRHDQIIEHRHYTKGQSPTGFDASYQASTGLIPIDLQNWHEYCATGQLNADIARIDPGNPGFTPAELHQFNRKLNIPQWWGQPVV